MAICKRNIHWSWRQGRYHSIKSFRYFFFIQRFPLTWPCRIFSWSYRATHSDWGWSSSTISFVIHLYDDTPNDVHTTGILKKLKHVFKCWKTWQTTSEIKNRISLPGVNYLESDPLGILEIAIWSPDLVQPFWVENLYCKIMNNHKMCSLATLPTSTLYHMIKLHIVHGTNQCNVP